MFPCTRIESTMSTRVYQMTKYRSRISFAAGNRRRPAAISAGKQNATPVYFALHASNKTITRAVLGKGLWSS